MWRVFATLVCALPCLAGDPPLMEKQRNVMVPMRDGVRLSTSVYRPPAATAPLPAVLVRTPYNKGADLSPGYYPFLAHGYAVIIQDVRGRYASEGVFRPIDQEGSDGWDTLDWIAKQSWSSGRVGMVGGSYLGIAQWKVAVMGNRHLAAMVPVVSGDDDYRDRFYSPGGAFKLGHRLEWMAENSRAPGFPQPEFSRFILHLPLRTADVAATGQRVAYYQDALDHPACDAFWKSASVRESLDKVRIPVFSVGGWYDNYAESDLDAFARMSHNGRARRILIGPWAHNMSTPFDEINFGPEARANIRRFEIEWFDRWVKSGENPAQPVPKPVRIFVMGANTWRDETEWPLAGTRWTRYYLASKGHANTLAGDGALRLDAKRRSQPDAWTHDPRHPVPTRGGAVCCNPKIIPWGPMDQRSVEQRPDVLVFSSDALEHDTEVTGPIRVVLSIATDARDTDVTAKLVDAYPDGHAVNLTDGVLRLRYRLGLDNPTLAEPGKIDTITVDAGVTSNVFKAGHRIRLEIASSNFPRFDRNPGTGRPVAGDTELRVSHQTLYHDTKHPSYAELPVIPPR